jgi:hypothetical protein
VNSIGEIPGFTDWLVFRRCPVEGIVVVAAAAVVVVVVDDGAAIDGAVAGVDAGCCGALGVAAGA